MRRAIAGWWGSRREPAVTAAAAGIPAPAPAAATDSHGSSRQSSSSCCRQYLWHRSELAAGVWLEVVECDPGELSSSWLSSASQLLLRRTYVAAWLLVGDFYTAGSSSVSQPAQQARGRQAGCRRRHSAQRPRPTGHSPHTL